ncbi:beta-N-acetylhexosaminidase [Olivibacter sp. SDN3]|uniref:glycoside hydrolase family 20 zincin-like fold domain-containing protein n=1 Tax=Olivibacter sp. SDN3 TaxID=2764720 RepID=UPI0016511DE8|nr:glycoside hydrolase family 20 zincin-like fold domain-containing protein [Olivibacter sp. SDN3]QNL51043.1 beta-N-acetylhexosaminidase [Olivibacter sp. SDN3]
MKVSCKVLLIIFIFEYLIILTGCKGNKVQYVPIIPEPQSLEWTPETFDLKKCRGIVIKSRSLTKEAKLLRQRLAEKGNALNFLDTRDQGKHTIVLLLDTVKTDQLAEEAYRLQVNSGGISLSANTTHGIFNGLQTLFQLIKDGSLVQGCNIVDFPAYQWRGYMVDVGRNYQSVECSNSKLIRWLGIN